MIGNNNFIQIKDWNLLNVFQSLNGIILIPICDWIVHHYSNYFDWNNTLFRSIMYIGISKRLFQSDDWIIIIIPKFVVKYIYIKNIINRASHTQTHHKSSQQMRHTQLSKKMRESPTALYRIKIKAYRQVHVTTTTRRLSLQAATTTTCAQ